MSRIKGIWSDIKYWTFSFFILALLFEMISSVVFFHRYSMGNFATAELFKKFRNRKPDLSRFHKMHEMVRPDSGAAISRQIADETWEANKYTYEPWLQFKVADFTSNYVNISGFERKSIPDVFVNPGSKDTIDIFFMGGSAMFGYNASDYETIPSQFLRLYRQKYPKGRSVRVHNYGIPYYYSKQELMLLTKLIFEGARPDMIIFLDGLNDFYPSRMLYYDRPHFSYAMEQAFNTKMFQKNKQLIIDTSDQLFIDVPGIPQEKYYEELLHRYINNVRHAADLSKKINAKSYFFCQPVPFYRYPNQKKDPVSLKANYDRFDYIYPRLEKNADSLEHFVFLGNMLTEEKGMPFVDQVHYSPEFSGKMAGKILAAVENDLSFQNLNDYGTEN